MYLSCRLADSVLLLEYLEASTGLAATSHTTDHGTYVLAGAVSLV